jgi:predicted RNase H-like HicB family nuclease
MLFPILIYKDKSSDYGVIVPGLPGCYSAGSTMDEAIINAKEAIELHLEGLAEDGMEIPEQKSMDAYNKELKAGGIAALVEVDTAPYEVKHAERVNVTFPKPLLLKIDKASERLGMTRSGFLQKAARELINTTGPAKVGRALKTSGARKR